MFALFACLLLLVVVAAGCPRRPAERPDTARTRQRTPPPDTAQADDTRALARSAVASAKKTEGVKDAYGIVVGDVVLLGINLEPGARDGKAIERTVAERVPKDVKGIGRAYVTTDPDLVTRVQRVFEKIEEGRPLSGVWEELLHVWGRVVPQSTGTGE